MENLGGGGENGEAIVLPMPSGESGEGNSVKLVI